MTSRLRSVVALAMVLAGPVLAACSSTPSAPPTAPVVTVAPTPTPALPTQTGHPIALSVQSCVDTSKQLCDPPAIVTVRTDGALVVDFTASPGHCSSVIVHILVDGTEVYVSGELAAGASTGAQDLGPVSAGQHEVAIRGEGVVGGCNSGGVSSWSGSLSIALSALPGADPTPLLGTPGP